MQAMTPELFALLKARGKPLNVDPPNLAPSGSRVRTSTGHLCELVGWLPPNPDEDSPLAGEHIAVLSIIEGPIISGDEKLALAPESEVTLVKVQKAQRASNPPMKPQ